MTKETVREDIRDIIESKYYDFDLMTSYLDEYLYERLGEYLQTLGVEVDCVKVDSIFFPTSGQYSLVINVVYMRNKHLHTDEIGDFQEKILSNDMMRIYTIKKIIA